MNNKAQVVYYLSHGGRLEQPHFIEVEHQNERLLMRDVKKRLMLLRGKDMPDAFSWAYKRSYKNDFIWNDVTEEDAILPLSGQEYILKGSDNYLYNGRECCKTRTDEHRRKENEESCSSPSSLLSPYKCSLEHMRASEIYDRLSPLSSQTDQRSPKYSGAATSGSLRVNRQLMESLTQAKASGSGSTAGRNAPSEESISHNIRDVKLYKTPASHFTADHGRDAATQTEDNGKFDQEKGLSQAVPDAQCGEGHHASRKPGRCCLGQPSSEEECNVSAGKQGSSAAVLRQLLTCGGVDTNTSPSVQSQVQNWSRSKPEGSLTHQEGEVTSYQGPKSTTTTVYFNNKRDFHHNEDPETMPEVVKETSDDARSLKEWTPRSLPEKFPASPRAGFENESPRYSSRKLASRGASSLKYMANNGEVKQPERPTSLPPELSPPKKELRCKDDRPLTPGRSRLDWEKTLQEAVQLSAPPADFRQILQACPQCGRTFKPESLKVHMRGCRGANAKMTRQQ